MYFFAKVTEWKTGMVQLKNNLKQFRFKRGQISQQALAEQVEVSRQTVNAIENGKFNPSVKLALRMAAVLRCRVEDIFYLAEDQ